MSSSRTLVALPLLLLIGMLAGCGYSPLYGTSSPGVEASEALSNVSVSPIGGGLVGVDVRSALLDHINPNGEPAAPAHRLEIQLMPALSGLLVQPDSAITRYNYSLIGNYKLIDVATGKVVNEGSVTGTSAYNVVTSEYATVVARRDAERRAAQSISDELALRLALFLKKKAS